VNVLSISFFIFAALAIKVPIIWYIHKTINDVPVPELDDDGREFVKADYEPGPRVRGPHDNGSEFTVPPRRGDKGHDESAPKPQVTSGSSAGRARSNLSR
jgi:hypothetical protein